MTKPKAQSGKCTYCFGEFSDVYLVRLRSIFKDKWQEKRLVCPRCLKNYLRGLYKYTR